eukprot:TRINITY_DN1018_c0_g1_i1.p2 TRINITY_DN1018_c0_g1~~TRINITY_DN1018_c0_g1_i1.p2  ORF type:complete len:237 (+),score=42.16 TRINITY_DN1018_c0_g1_i1:162-872(+)
MFPNVASEQWFLRHRHWIFSILGVPNGERTVFSLHQPCPTRAKEASGRCNKLIDAKERKKEKKAETSNQWKLQRMDFTIGEFVMHTYLVQERHNAPKFLRQLLLHKGGYLRTSRRHRLPIECVVPNLSHIVEQTHLTRNACSFHDGVFKTHVLEWGAFDHSICLDNICIVVLIIMEIKLGWRAKLPNSLFNGKGKCRQLVEIPKETRKGFDLHKCAQHDRMVLFVLHGAKKNNGKK